jgi:hypothetical protein
LLQLDLCRRTVGEKLLTFDGHFAYLNENISAIYRIGKNIITSKWNIVAKCEKK